MSAATEQATAPGVRMSGPCRTACPTDPNRQPSATAEFLHERCTLEGCACPSHRERS